VGSREKWKEGKKQAPGEVRWWKGRRNAFANFR